MQITPVNNSQVKNNNQNKSFKAFIATPTELKAIHGALGSLPKTVKENFRVYSMKELVKLAFPEDKNALDRVAYIGSPIENTYLTRMEAKLLESGPIETLAERIKETLQKAKRIEVLSTVRKALDVKNEKASLLSIKNLKEELIGKDAPTYTMQEICARGLDTFVTPERNLVNKEEKIIIPCLGDFMSNAQIAALQGLSKFGGSSMSKEMALEAIKKHPRDMYEYLYGLISRFRDI